MLVTINKIIKCEDDEGQFGPQKRIVFKDSGGQTISGWVAIKEYDPSQWKAGCQVNIEVKQNGKYLNFKLLKKEKKATGEEAVPESIIVALRHIYKTLCEVKDLLTHNKSSSEFPHWNVREPGDDDGTH